MSKLAFDDHGHPILLGGQGTRSAASPGTPGVDVPSASGNKAHIPAGQPGGGRFGKRGPVEEAIATRGTAGLTADELARRMDAVREAAREFETFKEQDIAEWLRGRINRPFSKADLDQFLADVRSQQITDLIDALDEAERGSLRGRRRVRVVMPKGYRRLTLHRLEPGELTQVFLRLKAKGWNQSQLKSLTGKLPEERRGAVEGIV